MAFGHGSLVEEQTTDQVILRMNIEEFRQSLKLEQPPDNLEAPVLRGLWWAGKGDWDAAHDIAQSQEGVQSFDHLHAYLHRVEGDEWNAGYWYRRAGERIPDFSTEEEWDRLVKKMLS